MSFNFAITSSKPISEFFRKSGIFNFSEACLWVQNLPYKRNQDKQNPFCIAEDNGGTCSTKHAFLKILAEENNGNQLKLILGIFSMNTQNTPKVKGVLEKYHLIEIPEAHNYLKLNKEILDLTRKNSSAKDFENDLLEEIEIAPNQITDFKVQYHQNFLQKYLIEHSEIPYSIENFWKIREECILALQQ